jgi:uncharacterized membrane protein required for colicin V production
MVAVFSGSQVPRSIFFTLTSFYGAKMQGFFARISSSLGFICATTVAISSLSSAVCALVTIWIT